MPYNLCIPFIPYLFSLSILCWQIEHRSLTLGEVLDGDRMAISLYDIKFKESFDQKELCKLVLKSEDISRLQVAIEDLYYFEFVYGKGIRWDLLIVLKFYP